VSFFRIGGVLCKSVKVQGVYEVSPYYFYGKPPIKFDLSNTCFQY
jgi:hypothetical protein